MEEILNYQGLYLHRGLTYDNACCVLNDADAFIEKYGNIVRFWCSTKHIVERCEFSVSLIFENQLFTECLLQHPSECIAEHGHLSLGVLPNNSYKDQWCSYLMKHFGKIMDIHIDDLVVGYYDDERSRSGSISIECLP